MIKVCGVCCGKKFILGLGAMYGECKNCKGIGHVKVEVMAPVEVVSEVIEAKVDKRKKEYRESIK